MAKPTEVATLIRKGVPPVAIARELGISEESAHYTIFKAVSRNMVTFTEVYLSIRKPDYQQDNVERLLAILFAQANETSKNDWFLRYQRYAIAEHTLQIREIEQILHRDFRAALQEQFGSDEDGWWRKAVPSQIRQECAARRENDPAGASHEMYAYTMLINLQTIAKKHWSVLEERVKFLRQFKQQDFFKAVEKLNGIRNIVMHPVRIHIPDDEDIRFVEELHRKICS